MPVIFSGANRVILDEAYRPYPSGPGLNNDLGDGKLACPDCSLHTEGGGFWYSSIGDGGYYVYTPKYKWFPFFWYNKEWKECPTCKGKGYIKCL